MPTSIRQSTSFSEGDIQVLAGSEFRAVRGLSYDLSFLQADADGNKIMPAGSIITKNPGASGYCRILPLTNVTTAVAAAGLTIVVRDAKLFKNAENLVIARPYATLTMGGTPAATNTVVLTLDGQAITTTLDATTAASTTTAATAVAAVINASPLARDKITAIAQAAIVYCYGKTQVPYHFATSAGGAGVTSTASAAVMQENVAIKDIHASTAINTTTNTITLATGGSAVVLPVGAPIGVAVVPSDYLGISIEKYLLSNASVQENLISNDIAAFDEAQVYQARLQHWDQYVAQALPQVSVV